MGKTKEVKIKECASGIIRMRFKSTVLSAKPDSRLGKSSGKNGGIILSFFSWRLVKTATCLVNRICSGKETS